MVSLDKKDWVRLRDEATQQLKQAAIMARVNQDILNTAEREIKAIEEAEKTTTTTTPATSDKDSKIEG